MDFDKDVVIEEYIKQNIRSQTYKTIAMRVGQQFGVYVSEHTVKQKTQQLGLKRRECVPDADLHKEVDNSVTCLGPCCGKRLVKGHLLSKGIKASEKRIGDMMRELRPREHAVRVGLHRQLRNPIPYTARYFGHKLHIDQNEKLVMHGMCHICAIDGYSSKIIRHCVFPAKNCVDIYADFYIPMLLEYGMRATLRVDHSTEWNLMLSVQDYLKTHRPEIDRKPYIQSKSSENLKIERYWVGVNQKVNYPIKLLLNEMASDSEFDLDSNFEKTSVSYFVCNVARYAVKQHTAAWNNHRIAGRGIPNELASNSAKRLRTPSNIPDRDTAVHSYPGKLKQQCSWYTPLPAVLQPVLKSKFNERTQQSLMSSTRSLFSTDQLNSRAIYDCIC